jgi:prepilin-type N-terminal cleavage/methylation domain-containing protein
MKTPRLANRPGRPGFTLIELIVAISIIAFLAGIAILIIPNLNDQQRAPRGAFSLQQWLLTAKNRAMRDNAARGVRISFTGTQDVKSGVITFDPVLSVQYTEQPDDFIVLPGVAQDPVNPARMLPFRRIATFVSLTAGTDLTKVVLEAPGAQAPTPLPDFAGGFPTDSTLWPVQVGDYLEINGGLPHLIIGVGPSDPTNNPTAIDMLTLASPVPVQIPQANPAANTNPVMNYRILRGPRVIGDEQLQLPDEIGIDLNTNVAYGNPLPTVLTSTTPINATTNKVAGTIDILFSPQGAVVGRGTATEAIYLWVRDTSLNLFEGDNTLVVTYTRSGAVSAYPVNNTSGQDPYAFAKTGRASGL